MPDPAAPRGRHSTSRGLVRAQELRLVGEVLLHPRTDEAGFETATQLFINPGECLDCGACVPACTSDAIFSMDEVPADKQHAVAANEAHFA